MIVTDRKENYASWDNNSIEKWCLSCLFRKAPPMGHREEPNRIPNVKQIQPGLYEILKHDEPDKEAVDDKPYPIKHGFINTEQETEEERRRKYGPKK